MSLNQLSDWLFQFHLVRLKEFAERTGRGHSYISIPFSTIKREKVTESSPFPFISIPFSTIKSLQQKYTQPKLRIFQFHLVRLKALRSKKKEAEKKFQFHLVRLKGFGRILFKAEEQISIPFSTIKSIIGRIIISTSIIFQFHLVRLKVFGSENEDCPEHISIPFSTIKRRTAIEKILHSAYFNSI